MKWKPIKDAPRDGTRVLLGRHELPISQGYWSGGRWVLETLWSNSNEYGKYWAEDSALHPTHYAEITPVPVEPPEDSERFEGLALADLQVELSVNKKALSSAILNHFSAAYIASLESRIRKIKLRIEEVKP